MIDIHEAEVILKNEHPDRHITQAIDYDSDWFVFCALKSLDKVDYDAPYYAVNKKTGDICSFTPMLDLNKFIEASRDRSYQIAR